GESREVLEAGGRGPRLRRRRPALHPKGAADPIALRDESTNGSGELDPEAPRSAVAHAATGRRELAPVVLPVARDAREQARIRRRALGYPEDHATAVDDADLAGRLPAARHVAAAVVEVEDLARQRDLGQVLRRRRSR